MAALTLTTSRRLRDQPDLDAAVRAGQLSGAQAAEIAQTGTDTSPEAAAALIPHARSDSLQGLRARAQETRAALSADDLQARHARIHARRYLHTWIDGDGAARLDARMTPDALARLRARLAPFERAEVDMARRQGRHERPDLYALDALMAATAAATSPATASLPASSPSRPEVVEGAEGPGASGRRRRRRRPSRAPAMVIVRIDAAALDRGHAEPGERCEIDGVGPVPVPVAESLMADAFVAAVLTDGIDIRRVIHLGRSATAAQRTALYVRDPECVVPGCHVHDRLEIDHVTGWTKTRKTCLDDLARLCHHHHALKTKCSWVLRGPPGAWTFTGPDGIGVGPDPPAACPSAPPDEQAEQLGFPDG